MYVNVFMSMYLSFCLSFSFSTHVPLPYLSVFFQRESERERERERESEQARKCFMLENIYLTQKKALMKTQGSKKSTRHTDKHNKMTNEILAYR